MVTVTAEEKKGKSCKTCSMAKKLGIKPFTKQNILYYYAPLQGVVSFTTLSVNSMNPSILMRLFPKRDVTSILLVSSMVGTGLYLYDRPHLRTAAAQTKFSFSVYGSLLFNFGSLLLFAVAKSYLPENSKVATVVGLASCYSLIKVGTSYLDYVDSATNSK